MAGRKKDPLHKSFSYAFEGIFTCIRNERNMKIHIAVAALVVIAGWILGLSITEWCICLGLFGLVMALELVNTAVEAVVDLVTTSRSSPDRSDHGSDRRTSDLCTERAFVSEAALKMIRFYERRYILWN